jgi:ribosomal protein S13
LVPSPASLKRPIALAYVQASDRVPLGSKYRPLLEDERVRKWVDYVARGSAITAEVYLRRLGRVCEDKGILPSELLNKDEESLWNFLNDLISEMEIKGRTGGYIQSTLKAIKSWLSFNGIDIRRKLKVRGANDTPTLRENQPITASLLRQLYSASSLKVKCIISLLAGSGIRPEVIGNHDGSDGLRLGDIPELEIEEGRVKFTKTPPMLIVRQELSKARHQYFTFITREGCEFLSHYLVGRMRAGEVLTPASPLIAPDVTKGAVKPFVKAWQVGRLVRKRLEQCGIKARPYDLRTRFDTQLMLAESHDKMLRDYRVFLMGHKGDIEHRYTVNRRNLSYEVVEDMRGAFERSQRYLCSSSSGSGDEGEDAEGLRERAYRQLLMLAGFTDKEIDEQRLLDLKDEELAARMKERLKPPAVESKRGRQKLIPLDELEKYLEEGWRCEHVIESMGKAIVSLPESEVRV